MYIIILFCTRTIVLMKHAYYRRVREGVLVIYQTQVEFRGYTSRIFILLYNLYQVCYVGFIWRFIPYITLFNYKATAHVYNPEIILRVFNFFFFYSFNSGLRFVKPEQYIFLHGSVILLYYMQVCIPQMACAWTIIFKILSLHNYIIHYSCKSVLMICLFKIY